LTFGLTVFMISQPTLRLIHLWAAQDVALDGS